jgi:hypothetical protein
LARHPVDEEDGGLAINKLILGSKKGRKAWRTRQRWQRGKENPNEKKNMKDGIEPKMIRIWSSTREREWGFSLFIYLNGL